MTMSVEEAIAHGEALERQDPDAAIAWFADLAATHPGNALVLFAYAGAFDFAGKELEAVAPYRKAREFGLPDEQLPRWYVQFGSTLRNNGAFEESVALLTEAHARYPDNAAIACFLALSLQSAGDPARALRTTIEALLRESAAGRIDLHRYDQALSWYAADLTGDAGGT